MLTRIEHLKSLLVNIGFEEKEAAIFLSILELKEAIPSTIARRSNVKRPTTYVILEKLQRKGLVSHVRRNDITYFRAVNPNLLIEEENDKLLKLKNALPEMIKLQNAFGTTPQLTIFEGKNGLIQIMEDTLTTKTGLLCWCDVDTAIDTILKDYFPTYLKKKIQKKIWLNGIFTYNKGGLRHKKYQKSELREVHLVPKDKFPFKNEINIYDDKVAIISHQDEIGVIIQNQNIADTQRAIFNLAFEYAKILEKDLLTKEDLAYLKSEDT
ncbi:MAG: helix-turn-helix domain-containing protein [Candidatus Gracilibacteria bacterium]|jgi:sugar-specific transcriptional regulator TrmB